ncbi:MAG TPA: serpin family protein [Polyangiaceae bacterium]
MAHASKVTALACLVGALAGCNEGPDDGTPEPAPFEQVKSDQQRLPATASSESVRELTGSNAQFLHDLWRAEAPAGNFFFSPHSISIALAMTYAGSAGTTQQEMATTLHFAQPEPELHAAFNSLDQALATRGQNARGVDGKPFRLRIVNSTWAQHDYAFLPSYLDVLAEHYGAAMNLLDFAMQPEQARATINGWVNERTEERIPELLPEGVIVRDTVLVLTNAVYFNASWNVPFKPEDTREGEFAKLDGSAINVPLMHQYQETRYAEGSGWRAVSLPYDGDEVSMLVVLPDVGQFDSVAQAMTAEQIGTVLDGLSSKGVTITLPKFEIRSKLSLAERLAQMGMPSAFEDADFSRMDGSRFLSITDVIHEAFVKVNEAGTEAAAATAVVVGRASAPEPATFEATRPFLFFILDNETRAIIFAGQVVDPTTSSGS